MKTFTLSTGDKIPALGLGTWLSPSEKIKLAVESAIDTGYHHIDCASVYANEKSVGEALTSSFANNKIKREQLWITSKLWNSFHKAEHVEAACKQTLNDLQLDYLDLYLIHWPIAFVYETGLGIPDKGEGFISLDDIPTIETWQAMEALVDQGLVKNIGVSNFSISKLDALIKEAKHKPTVNQVECHPYLAQNELLAYCKQNNIHVTAYSPLGSGDRFDGQADHVYLLKNDVILSIADKHKATPAQIILAWQMDRGVSVIPKSVTPKRIAENFAALQVCLDDGDKQQINALNKNHRYIDGSFWEKPGSPYTIKNLWA